MKRAEKIEFPSLAKRAQDLGLEPDELHLLELVARGDDGASIMHRFRLSRRKLVLALLRVQVKTGTRSVRGMEGFAEAHGL
jgi:hypothetical protein